MSITPGGGCTGNQASCVLCSSIVGAANTWKSVQCVQFTKSQFQRVYSTYDWLNIHMEPWMKAQRQSSYQKATKALDIWRNDSLELPSQIYVAVMSAAWTISSLDLLFAQTQMTLERRHFQNKLWNQGASRRTSSPQKHISDVLSRGQCSQRSLSATRALYLEWFVVRRAILWNLPSTNRSERANKSTFAIIEENTKSIREPLRSKTVLWLKLHNRGICIISRVILQSHVANSLWPRHSNKILLFAASM